MYVLKCFTVHWHYARGIRLPFGESISGLLGGVLDHYGGKSCFGPPRPEADGWEFESRMGCERWFSFAVGLKLCSCGLGLKGRVDMQISACRCCIHREFNSISTQYVYGVPGLIRICPNLEACLSPPVILLDWWKSRDILVELIIWNIKFDSLYS